MTPRLVHRPARAVRPLAPPPDVPVSTPPPVGSATSPGLPIQALLPLVGAVSSMTMMLVLRNNPLLVLVGARGPGRRARRRRRHGAQPARQRRAHPAGCSASATWTTSRACARTCGDAEHDRPRRRRTWCTRAPVGAARRRPRPRPPLGAPPLGRPTSSRSAWALGDRPGPDLRAARPTPTRREPPDPMLLAEARGVVERFSRPRPADADDRPARPRRRGGRRRLPRGRASAVVRALIAPGRRPARPRRRAGRRRVLRRPRRRLGVARRRSRTSSTTRSSTVPPPRAGSRRRPARPGARRRPRACADRAQAAAAGAPRRSGVGRERRVRVASAGARRRATATSRAPCRRSTTAARASPTSASPWCTCVADRLHEPSDTALRLTVDEDGTRAPSRTCATSTRCRSVARSDDVAVSLATRPRPRARAAAPHARLRRRRRSRQAAVAAPTSCSASTTSRAIDVGAPVAGPVHPRLPARADRRRRRPATRAARPQGVRAARHGPARPLHRRHRLRQVARCCARSSWPSRSRTRPRTCR